MPQLASLAVTNLPTGYGLLGQVQPQAPPRPAAAPRGEAEALPALRVRQAAPRAAETSAINDPQKRALDPDQPLPPKKKGTEDEDLLP